MKISKYQWNESKCEEYKAKLASGYAYRKFNRVFETLSNDDSIENTDTCLENFVSVHDSVC